MVQAEVPPRVKYDSTMEGASLQPVILALSEWGQGYLNSHRKLLRSA